MHAVNLDAGFHLAARTGAPADRGERAGLVPVPDLAACGHAAQPAALFDRESGMAMLVKELAKTLGPLRHPRQRAGARRDRRRRLCRRSLAGKAHPARPHRPGRRPRADGARGAVQQVSAYVTGAAIVVDGGLSLTNWFEPPELDDL